MNPTVHQTPQNLGNGSEDLLQKGHWGHSTLAEPCPAQIDKGDARQNAMGDDAEPTLQHLFQEQIMPLVQLVLRQLRCDIKLVNIQTQWSNASNRKQLPGRCATRSGAPAKLFPFNLGLSQKSHDTAARWRSGSISHTLSLCAPKPGISPCQRVRARRKGPFGVLPALKPTPGLFPAQPKRR
jgi:hypothetical protein